MKKNYIEITEAEAKEIYCKGGQIYITNNKRTFWRVPCTYEYGSHATSESLFKRSIPEYEGETKYFRV